MKTHKVRKTADAKRLFASVQCICFNQICYFPLFCLALLLSKIIKKIEIFPTICPCNILIVQKKTKAVIWYNDIPLKSQSKFQNKCMILSNKKNYYFETAIVYCHKFIDPDLHFRVQGTAKRN